MKYVIWLVAGITISTTTFLWLSAEVPGGEKRYEHFIRLTADRQSFPGMTTFR
jgi:hypothetical protein